MHVMSKPLPQPKISQGGSFSGGKNAYGTSLEAANVGCQYSAASAASQLRQQTDRQTDRRRSPLHKPAMHWQLSNCNTSGYSSRAVQQTMHAMLVINSVTTTLLSTIHDRQHSHHITSVL